MSDQDYEQLTLFPEDSHASRFPAPGSSEARTMTVTSGRKCLESYTNSGPLGCLVRMCLESSIWHSTRCLLTWKRKDTKYNRSLFQLAASMPRTNETGSAFWPTPSTGAGLCGGTGNFKTLQAMAKRGLITEEERRQLSQGNGGKTNPGLLEWMMGYEQQFTKLIPTPRASDYKGAAADRFYTHTHTHTHTGAVPASALRTTGSHSAWDNWPVEPGIPRVVDGIPNRVDRIKCLGNAVVPQQFYPFFAAILRKNAWLKTGCNSLEGKIQSKPMSFWTEQDVLRYIVKNHVEICSVYGDVVAVDELGNEYDPNTMLTDSCKLKCTGCQRTGCVYCAFGAHLETGETRFQRLAKTHPRQYEYCMGGGQWADNPAYDATAPEYDGEWKNWNPKKIWVPSKDGLGLKAVFDMVNEIYGKDFYRYD